MPPKEARKVWIEWLIKQDRERPVSGEFLEFWRDKGGPHPGTPSVIRTLSQKDDRERSVLEDRPARFNILDNTYASVESSIVADDDFGLEQVLLLDPIIEDEARRQDVDPDLIRAIIFVENSHGWYDQGLQHFGLNKTYRPMNINPDIWGGLGISHQSAKNPRVNIRAGTTLLKRLIDRIEEPTPRKVAALWQFTGAEHTDHSDRREYVAKVGQLYHEKPWASASSGVYRTED